MQAVGNRGMFLLESRMSKYTRGNAVTCIDGRTGFVDHQHDGKEPGPHGLFYVVIFETGPEWQPEENLYHSLALEKDSLIMLPKENHND